MRATGKWMDPTDETRKQVTQRDHRLAAIVFIAVLALAAVTGYRNLSYNWQWYRVAQYFFFL